MYKKFLALLLAVVMVFAISPLKALAVSGDVYQVTSWPDGKAKLLGGAPEWVFFKQGNPPDNGIAAIWTPEKLTDAEEEEYLAEAKAADNSIKNITSSASVFFFSGNQTITNGNNNTGKYKVGEIDGAWYVFVLSGSLSHFYYSEGEALASVEVTANVIENFQKIVLQDQYKYDLQNIYEREVHNVYIPMFERKSITAGNGTLVTWRDNMTIPGGTFGNGMTYVEIDAEKATEEGYTFGIADSSPINRYVGYGYKVRIEGNDLVISFDNRFISASVSAKVYSAAPLKHDPSGHIALRTGDELRLPLPAPAGSSGVPTSMSAMAVKSGDSVTITVKDGTKTFTSVVTFAKNTTKTYAFNGYTVEVIYNGNGVKSAAVVSRPTAASPDESTTAGKYYLFFHLESGIHFYEANYSFIGWSLAETKYGDPYLVNTITGDPYLVAENVEVSRTTGTRPYAGNLSLTVDGVETPLEEVFYLEPGIHAFTLSFAGRTVTERWVVSAGSENKFAFETQQIDGVDEITHTALVEANQLPDKTTDKWCPEVYLGSEDPESPESIQFGIYTPAR